MENQPSVFNNAGPQQNLPNATAVLVLGIISIVGCFCYGIPGLACGIIALVLANKDMVRYNSSPSAFSSASYNNLKAGKVCAIIGTALAGLFLAYVIIVVIFYGAAF